MPKNTELKHQSIVDEVQLADEADENFIKALQGVRRKTTNAYLKDDATFKALGVYTIWLDVFDGELLFPLLGDPFKAEPKSEDVPKLSLILDPKKSKVAPFRGRGCNSQAEGRWQESIRLEPIDVGDEQAPVTPCQGGWSVDETAPRRRRGL